MQRNDLIFLALVTAVAAIASAPPLPTSAASWNAAAAEPTARAEQMQEIALEIRLAPIP